MVQGHSQVEPGQLYWAPQLTDGVLVQCILCRISTHTNTCRRTPLIEESYLSISHQFLIQKMFTEHQLCGQALAIIIFILQKTRPRDNK